MSQLPEGTADAFNQWMQNYIDNPKGYRREWETVRGFLSTPDGAAPDYGRTCVALLERLLSAQTTAAVDDPTPAAPPD